MTKTILILAIAAAFVAGTITTTGLVYAHGGDVTLIHACVGKKLGLIRIVSPTTTCTNLENPLDWSIKGTKGDKGDPGPQGIQGEPGTGGGIPNIYARPGGSAEISPSGFMSAIAFCDSGDRAISGGIGSSSTLLKPYASFGVDVDGTITYDNPVGWLAAAVNQEAFTSQQITAIVYCIDETP